MSFLRTAPRGGSSGTGVAHPSSTRVSSVGGCLSPKAGHGRHWCLVNRASSGIHSVNPCEGDAHEQYHLPRRPRGDRPRDLGLSRIALTRQDAPRTVAPPAHGSPVGRLRPRAGRFAVIGFRHRSSRGNPGCYVHGSPTVGLYERRSEERPSRHAADGTAHSCEGNSPMYQYEGEDINDGLKSQHLAWLAAGEGVICPERIVWAWPQHVGDRIRPSGVS